MNKPTTRRNFFRHLALGVAAFTVLPSALTYGRTWKATAGRLVVPLCMSEEATLAELQAALVLQRNLQYLVSSLAKMPVQKWRGVEIDGGPVVFSQHVTSRYIYTPRENQWCDDVAEESRFG